MNMKLLLSLQGDCLGLIRMFTLSSGAVTTIAGGSQTSASNGFGTAASFSYPQQIAMDSASSFALIADSNNYNVRLINLTTLAVSSLAGPGCYSCHSDGVGTTASFYYPSGIALNS